MLDESGAKQSPETGKWPSRVWWRSWARYGILVVVALMLAAVLLGLPR
jgi:hypothetical protein